jgi:opacity protein-like surface antigen
MKRDRLPRCLGATAAAACLASAAPAWAQDSNLGFFAGVRVWNVDWTTWGYGRDSSGQRATTQQPTQTKTLLIPVAGARWRDFLVSVGGFSSTTFTYPDGSTIQRKELDLNLGWYVTPGTALTVGYKRTAQMVPGTNFELAGPTIGLSATAPLGNGFSLYGLLGLGRLKPKGNVILDADYQLTEVGTAYNVPVGRFVRSITLTAGYRMQVINSKDVLSPDRTQNARDLTQGFNLGVSGVF